MPSNPASTVRIRPARRERRERHPYFDGFAVVPIKQNDSAFGERLRFDDFPGVFAGAMLAHSFGRKGTSGCPTSRGDW
jgi:hypothetical protein